MPDDDLEKLLGGFAADTLTPEEKQRLYDTALHDQQLFDLFADEQALKELLTDPVVRERLLRSLRETTSTDDEGIASWFGWFRRPAGLAWAGGLVGALFAVILGTNVYLESLREARSLVANEEAAPTYKPMPAPSAPQSTSPPMKESRLEAKAKQAASLKKEARTTMTPQRETLPTEPDRLQGPTESPPQKVLQSEEQPPDLTDHDQASGTLGAEPAVTGAAAPANRLATAQAGPASSVRSLFYGETAESTSELMREPQRHESTQRMERFEQLKGLSASNQAQSDGGSTKPLGLRFSLVMNEGEGPHDDRDTKVPPRLGSLDLMVESNQPSFFQVWGEEESLQPQLLFPFSADDPIASQLLAYQPRRIPIRAGYRSMTIRLSRTPFGQSSTNDAVEMKRSSPASLQESVASPGPSGSPEHVTYVVNPDPSSGMLRVRIPIPRPYAPISPDHK